MSTNSRFLVSLAVGLGLSACGSGGRSGSEAGPAVPDGASEAAALPADAGNPVSDGAAAERPALAEGGREAAALPSDVGVDTAHPPQDSGTADTATALRDVVSGNDSPLPPPDSVAAEAAVRADATDLARAPDAGGSEAAKPLDAMIVDTASSTGDLAPARLGELSPKQLNDMLATKDFLLIDVHTPNAGSIPGTDARIAYSDIPALVAFIGPNLDTKVVLTCLSGGMSKSAGEALVARGYRNIWELTGGTNAWTAAGYTLVHLDAGS